jgi:hypothetical protein
MDEEVMDKNGSDPSFLNFDRTKDCPDDELFACYIDGVLSTERKQNIEKHLKECELCHTKLMDIQYASIESDKKPVKMPKSIRKNILNHLKDRAPFAVVKLIYRTSINIFEQIIQSGKIVQLQPVDVRGARKTSIYRVNLKDIHVKIATYKDTNGSYDVWLKANNDNEGNNKYNWQLWINDKLCEQQPSENGEGLFIGLEPDDYQFILYISGQEIGVINFTLKDVD